MDFNKLQLIAKEIDKYIFLNDKDSIVFTEKLKLHSSKYASATSNLLLFEPNIFNRFTSAPPRYKERKLPFEIDRGFTDIDEYEIILPENIQVDALQDPVSIKNKFGEYQFSIEQISESKLVFKRKFILYKGQYSKEEYKSFRDFRLKVVRHDKSKIVLKQKS